MRAFGTIEGPVGVWRQQPRIVKATRCRAAGCFAVPYQGLSPVRGNLHAGFLGEG
jgi:hypothetical protein